MNYQKQLPYGSSEDQNIFGRIPHSSGESHLFSNIKINSNTAAYKANNSSQIHFGGERQVYNGDLRNSINRGPVNSNWQHNSGLTQNPNIYGQIGGDQLNTSSNMYNCSQKQYRKQKDPDTYDGKHAEWPDYICHFEHVALWNQWSEYEMASQLAMCLRGIAQRALSEPSRDDLSNYGRLKFSLTQRFCPPERKTAYRCEFRNRRRRRDESVSNYGYSLKRLAAHAFPAIPLNIRESLIIEQYISGLANPELKRHVQFSHPTTLDRAISLALEFEAFEGSQTSPMIKKPQDEDLISPICKSTNVNEKVDQNCSQTSIFTKLVEGMQEVQKSMMES
ncbi:unnamed protein product [Mytilus coruscus]|uniref:Retrotransposon gag domain-containing protein n=1 Tax=Mytilus coruscus TaxID=42192 RepID=A0A6J8DU41_MYTCO|nr:unnamed protein product [Mytilus coruscus]